MTSERLELRVPGLREVEALAHAEGSTWHVRVRWVLGGRGRSLRPGLAELRGELLARARAAEYREIVIVAERVGNRRLRRALERQGFRPVQESGAAPNGDEEPDYVLHVQLEDR